MIRRLIITLLAAIFLAVGFAASTPDMAAAKTRTHHGVAKSDKGGLAVKCKKGERMPGTVNRCPKKGWVAFMRPGESFKYMDTYYWKFYGSKKKAIRSSERSRLNKYLPRCVETNEAGECTKWKRYY